MSPVRAPSNRFRTRIRTLAAAVALSLVTLSGAGAQTPLKVGSGAGPTAEILEFAAEHARKQGLPVDVIEFSDWITPNEAVANGDIDANLFQHKPFLDAAIKARGYKLVPVAVTFVMPVGLFSKKVKSFDAVPAGATVAIANDPVNAARGLRLFAKAGLITLKPGAGDDATVLDITSNPKRLKFLELEAPQLPRALDDVAVAQVSYSFVERANLDPQSALISDGLGDPHYGLQVTVRADRKDDPKIARFVALFRSPEVKAFISEKFGKYVVPLW